MRTEVLSNGAVVRCRPVPPYATAQAWFQFKDPSPPTETLESIAGHEEAVPKDEDSPEYREWLREMQEVRRARATTLTNLELDHGVKEWLPPPPTGLPGAVVRMLRAIGMCHWQSEPPEDWEVPQSLQRYGVSAEGTHRRVAYIRLELLVTEEDMNKILSISSRGGALKSEDVEEAAEPFPDDAEHGGAPTPSADSAGDDGGSARGGDSSGAEVGTQETEDVV